MSDPETAPPTPPRRARLLRPSVVVALVVVAAGIGATVYGRDVFARALWRERSLPELRQEAQARPGEKFLLAQLALRQLEARQHAAAVQTLQSAISAGFSTESAWKTLAAATAAAGNPRAAVGVLQLGSRDPELAPKLRTPLTRLQELPPDASAEAVAQAIAPEGIGILARDLPPNFVSPWLARRGAADPEHAGFDTLQSLARSRPDDPRIQILWARALARNQRFPDAEAVLLPILQRNATDYDAAIALADVRYAAGLPARAGIIYRACLKERPDDFAAALGVARCAVDVKLVYLGVEAGLKAVALQPRSVDAWVLLGRAYFNQKLRWDKAVEAFGKARALDPKRTDYFAPYFDALRANGRPEEGAALLRQRLAAAPDDAQAHYLLATALLEQRADPATTDEAEKLLRRSLELEPNVPSTRARLAQILLEKDGGGADAAALLEQAVLLDPYHALSRRLLARAYRKQKMVPEAEAIERSARALDAYIKKKTPLEDAEAANPTDPKIHEQLARVYREGGELDKAASAEQMAFLLKNRKEDAERGLKTLMNATSLSASTEWAEDARKKQKKTP